MYRMKKITKNRNKSVKEVPWVRRGLWWGRRVYCKDGFWFWSKTEWVIDGESGDDGRDEVTCMSAKENDSDTVDGMKSGSGYQCVSKWLIYDFERRRWGWSGDGDHVMTDEERGWAGEGLNEDLLNAGRLSSSSKNFVRNSERNG